MNVLVDSIKGQFSLFWRPFLFVDVSSVRGLHMLTILRNPEEQLGCMFVFVASVTGGTL